jgi:hypothetical protein
MKKTFLYLSFFLLSNFVSLTMLFAVDQVCLQQCDGIHSGCMSKCLSPHPTYQSCKAVCDANRNLCFKQCGNYDDTQKKLQEMDSQK